MLQRQSLSIARLPDSKKYHRLNLERAKVFAFLELVLGIQNIASQDVCVIIDSTVHRFAKKKYQLKTIIASNDVTINVLNKENFFLPQVSDLIRQKRNGFEYKQMRQIKNEPISTIKSADLLIFSQEQHFTDLMIALSIMRMVQQNFQPENKPANQVSHSQTLADLQPRGNGHKPSLQGQKP